jgi:hypothetical protein
MLRSLRGRLVVLLVLLVAAAIATGMLMVGLFRQSATAQVGQADAENRRACDAIAGAYRFYSAGWQGPMPALDDEPFRGGLIAVVHRPAQSARCRGWDLAGRRRFDRLCLPDLRRLGTENRCPAGRTPTHPRG